MRDSTWFIGPSGAIHRRGDDISFLSTGGAGFSSISASSESDVWLVGEHRVVHWDGAKLEALGEAGGRFVSALPDRVWFGDSELVVRKGTTCQRYDLAHAHVTALAAGSASNVVLSLTVSPGLGRNQRYGSFGFDGAVWRSLPTPPFDAAFAVDEGRVRLVSNTGICTRPAPDVSCLAMRAKACAEKGGKLGPGAREPALPPPQLVGSYACALSPIELATTRLAPLKPETPADAGAPTHDPSPPGAEPTPDAGVGAEPDRSSAASSPPPSAGVLGGAGLALFALGLAGGVLLGRGRPRSP